MPPPNQTMATALVIDALPYTNTQNLTGAVGTGGSGENYDLWYKLPAALVSGAREIFGTLGENDTGDTDFNTRTFVYIGPVDPNPTPYLDAKSTTLGNGRVQIPLEATPQDYYFLVRTEDFVGSPTYNVTFDAYRTFELSTAPAAGTLFINSDEAGFPAGLIDPSSGFLGFKLDIVSGETGDILPSGIFALSDGENDRVVIYNADFSVRATVALIGNVASGNQVDTFYTTSQESGDTYLRAFSAEGVIGQRWGPLPANSLLAAVSRDETIAYITNGLAVGLGGGNVMRWDLVNDVQLADLAAAVAGYNLQTINSGISPGGILVLADDTILVEYFRTNEADSFIRRYDPAGTVLNTYTYAVVPWTGLDRIAHDITDDGLTFWVWVKGGGTATPGSAFGKGRFQQVRVSDGVALKTVESYEVQFGYQQRANAVITSQPFSHPFSCPFVLLRATLPAACPPSNLDPSSVTGLDGCPVSL